MMRIYERFYRLIENGSKTIEVRVAYLGMQSIKVGTIIRFVSGRSSCDRRVIRVARYNSFAEMMRQEDPKKINPHQSAEDQLCEIRKIFPSNKEKIGVLAFEFVLT
ncbi:MAG: ASCH domain-containing protein [Candidatus Moranbacteria bacterium]|nr:ASCH domain-containing protein [Candidatus Moranbacteria bacterium]